MAVNAELYAQALAELRAIPARPSEATAPEQSACCAGDRAAYQQHKLRGETPCQASIEANRAYLYDYARRTGRTTRAGRRRRTTA